MYKKILIGMDNSEDAKRAAKRAMEFAKRDKSKVIAFHSVLHHLSEMNLGFSGIGNAGSAVSLTIHQDYIKAGNELLKATEKMFKEANIEIESRLIYDIAPEDYIEQIVDEENFDLVILGCQGEHSKLERVFLGTVPEKVINSANCDVLIIR
ncbi:MAG: universal stress protein [Promethearchaeota archaeon]|nr:MAG: universal stress protein [Candidatus Lokiarchaeota archaeon]